MATAIIAVLGTLLGALTAGAMQHLVSLSARRDRADRPSPLRWPGCLAPRPTIAATST